MRTEEEIKESLVFFKERLNKSTQHTKKFFEGYIDGLKWVLNEIEPAKIEINSFRIIGGDQEAREILEKQMVEFLKKVNNANL